MAHGHGWDLNEHSQSTAMLQTSSPDRACDGNDGMKKTLVYLQAYYVGVVLSIFFMDWTITGNM